jgi:hypothetical protein
VSKPNGHLAERNPSGPPQDDIKEGWIPDDRGNDNTLTDLTSVVGIHLPQSFLTLLIGNLSSIPCHPLAENFDRASFDRVSIELLIPTMSFPF